MCVDWNNAVANNHALHGSLKPHCFHAPHAHAFAPFHNGKHRPAPQQRRIIHLKQRLHHHQRILLGRRHFAADKFHTQIFARIIGDKMGAVAGGGKINRRQPETKFSGAKTLWVKRMVQSRVNGGIGVIGAFRLKIRLNNACHYRLAWCAVRAVGRIARLFRRR